MSLVHKDTKDAVLRIGYFVSAMPAQELRLDGWWPAVIHVLREPYISRTIFYLVAAKVSDCLLPPDFPVLLKEQY